MAVPGVQGVHDLHIRTITSGFTALSAHVETRQVQNQHDILVSVRHLLAQRFSIEHATIQLETIALHQELEAGCGGEAEEITNEHALYHE